MSLQPIQYGLTRAIAFGTLIILPWRLCRDLRRHAEKVVHSIDLSWNQGWTGTQRSSVRKVRPEPTDIRVHL